MEEVIKLDYYDISKARSKLIFTNFPEFDASNHHQTARKQYFVFSGGSWTGGKQAECHEARHPKDREVEGFVHQIQEGSAWNAH